MAVLSDHHWPDPVAGLRAMQLVARRVVVVLFQFDADYADRFWLTRDYRKAAIDQRQGLERAARVRPPAGHRHRGSAGGAARLVLRTLRIPPRRAVFPGQRPAPGLGISRPAAAGAADRPADVRSGPRVPRAAAAAVGVRLRRAGAAHRPAGTGARRRPGSSGAGRDVHRGGPAGDRIGHLLSATTFDL